MNREDSSSFVVTFGIHSDLDWGVETKLWRLGGVGSRELDRELEHAVLVGRVFRPRHGTSPHAQVVIREQPVIELPTLSLPLISLTL